MPEVAKNKTPRITVYIGSEMKEWLIDFSERFYFGSYSNCINDLLKKVKAKDESNR